MYIEYFSVTCGTGLDLNIFLFQCRTELAYIYKYLYIFSVYFGTGFDLYMYAEQDLFAYLYIPVLCGMRLNLHVRICIWLCFILWYKTLIDYLYCSYGVSHTSYPVDLTDAYLHITLLWFMWNRIWFCVNTFFCVIRLKAAVIIYDYPRLVYSEQDSSMQPRMSPKLQIVQKSQGSWQNVRQDRSGCCWSLLHLPWICCCSELGGSAGRPAPCSSVDVLGISSVFRSHHQ